MIKRDLMAEPINGNNIIKREIPYHCPRCKVGEVGKRIYEKHELIGGVQLPYDANQWRQCHTCGYVIGKPDIPKQGQMTTTIEPIKSKFSFQRPSEHYEQPKHRRGFNERLNRDQDIVKDPEVKKALKGGAKLISYDEK